MRPFVRRLGRRGARASARSPRPECPRRGRSARSRPRRAAASGSRPSDFRLWRSILRRWPKAASVTFCSAMRFAGQRRAARNQLDQRRRHLGRRHERGRRDVEQDARLGAPAGQHRQPAVGLRAGRRGDAFRDLALEHQHQPVEPGRPRLGGQPGDQQRGRDVVGQVGDDARGAAAELWSRIEARAHRRRRRRGGPDSARRSPRARRWRARRARSRSRARAPLASSARVSPPGPGPISTTVTPSSGPAARAMRAVRLRSSRKFWPSDFLARRSCRRITSRSGGRSSIALMRGARRLRCVARREPRGELERGDQARRIGAAGAGDVEGGAVIGRGAHERKPERDVDGVVEGERLDRDQRLVVIHRERDVVARARRLVEHAVGRQRPARVDAFGDRGAAPPAGRWRDPRRRARLPRRHAD